MPTRRNARNSVPAITISDGLGTEHAFANFGDGKLFTQSRSSSGQKINGDFDREAIRLLVKFLVDNYEDILP